ncbi:MAG: phenylalanine--tRNA ligase subunit beta [Candidatus Thorarchaeota archaeon]
MVSFKIAYSDVVSMLQLSETTPMEELDTLFSYSKCEIEEYDLSDDYIKVDCKTSNRPDLWGVEGLTRELAGILGSEKGLPELTTKPSGFVLEVDPSIKEVRPYIACSIVRGISFTDFLIKQLIQLQEKIDFSFGRKRRKSSIGIYNINLVESPIFYGLTPRTTSFVPLGYHDEMNLSEILLNHEKGIEYGHILPEEGDLPILRGANGVILSLPPIINSNDVGRVNEETTDVLIEVTGTNLEVVQTVTNIVTQALRDRGGEVYSVEVKYPRNHGEAPPVMISPATVPFEIEVDPKEIARYLGLNLKKKDIKGLLLKRRLDVAERGKLLVVKYPPYRVDILHWVDVAEEVAIAYGYMQIPPKDLGFTTIGRISPRSSSENYAREILSCCALQEILSFTLTSPDYLSIKMGHDDSILSKCIEVANPVSQTYSMIRNRLLPGLLSFLSRNTHVEYPQQLFEVGETVTRTKNGIETITKAAVALAGAEISFEDCHSILDTFMTRLGVKYSIISTKDSEFLPGRAAKIVVDGQQAGIIGEISPDLLENWQIFVPTVSFELDLSVFKPLSLPPLFTYE